MELIEFLIMESPPLVIALTLAIIFPKKRHWIGVTVCIGSVVYVFWRIHNMNPIDSLTVFFAGMIGFLYFIFGLLIVAFKKDMSKKFRNIFLGVILFILALLVVILMIQ